MEIFSPKWSPGTSGTGKGFLARSTVTLPETNVDVFAPENGDFQ